MAGQAEDLNKLNDLLSEICAFLTNESVHKNLSPLMRKQAETLIARTKHQLQEISKITSKCAEHYGAYVDMDPKSISNNIDISDDNNDYSILDEPETSPLVSASELTETNHFADLPAKDMCRDMKYGKPAMKTIKRRMFFKVERIQNVFTGIHKNHLIVYSSENDAKPLKVFYLQHQRAIPAETKNLSNEFHLISTQDQSKKTTFVATNEKDMLQWVAKINRCNDSLNNNRVSVCREETFEHVDDSEPIYYDIETMKMQENQLKHQLNSDDEPPKLPSRSSTTTHEWFVKRPLVSNVQDDSSTNCEDEAYERFIESGTWKKSENSDGKPTKINPPHVPARPVLSNPPDLPKSMLWNAQLRNNKNVSSTPSYSYISWSEAEEDETYEKFRKKN